MIFLYIARWDQTALGKKEPRKTLNDTYFYCSPNTFFIILNVIRRGKRIDVEKKNIQSDLKSNT